VEGGDTVAVDVAPKRRDAVDVLVVVEVGQQAAVGPRHDQRPLGEVVLHRGEGVPEVVVVPALQLFAGGVHDASTSTGVPTPPPRVRAALPWLTASSRQPELDTSATGQPTSASP